MIWLVLVNQKHSATSKVRFWSNRLTWSSSFELIKNRVLPVKSKSQVKDALWAKDSWLSFNFFFIWYQYWCWFLNDTFFLYQYYEICFNKITLHHKKYLFLFFFSLFTFFTELKTHLLSHYKEQKSKGTKCNQHNKSVQIVLIKFK